MSRCVSDSASKGVLGVLKSVYLGFRKVKVQRVTIVEFGMYNAFRIKILNMPVLTSALKIRKVLDAQCTD